MKKNHSLLGLIAAATAMSAIPIPTRKVMLVDDLHVGTARDREHRDYQPTKFDQERLQEAQKRREKKAVKKAALAAKKPGFGPGQYTMVIGGPTELPAT